jgi:hypothetical protein
MKALIAFIKQYVNFIINFLSKNKSYLFRYFINSLKFIILAVIFINILQMLTNIYFYSFDYSNIDLGLNVASTGNSENSDANSNIPYDIPRWWPTGFPGGPAVVGIGMATYAGLTNLGGVSPRFRLIASLGASTLTAGNIVGSSVVENSVGFNRFM